MTFFCGHCAKETEWTLANLANPIGDESGPAVVSECCEAELFTDPALRNEAHVTPEDHYTSYMGY